MKREFGLARFGRKGMQPAGSEGVEFLEFPEAPDAIARSIAGFAGTYPIISGEDRGEETTGFALAQSGFTGLPPSFLSFGDEGRVTTEFPDFSVSAWDSGVDSQARVVVVGTANTEDGRQVLLARYDQFGELDDTFGGEGIVRTDVDIGSEDALAVAVDDRNRIVVGGIARWESDPAFLVLRYGPNGTLDTSFGSEGVVMTDFESSVFETVQSLSLDSEGRIVAAGIAVDPDAGASFALARYGDDGELDGTFGNGGLARPDFAETDAEYLADATLDYRGRVVAAGTDYGGDRQRVVVARFRPDGTLDETFDGDGVVFTDAPETDGLSASAVGVDDCGRIFVAGDATSTRDQRDRVVLLRFNTDGSLDRTFHRSGPILTDVGDATEWSTADLAVADSKVLVAGTGRFE